MELIILVYYINVRNIDSGTNIQEYLNKVHTMFSALTWPDDVQVQPFIIPVEDSSTRLECIFPLNKDDNTIKSAVGKLEDASKKFLEWLEEKE